MIKIPLQDIISKITEATEISQEAIDKKINEKLEQLSGLISKEGAAHIIANELGVKIFEQPSGKLQIKNILSGMRSVEFVGKVQQVSNVTEFTRKDGGSGKVGSIVVADETGSIRVVCWGDQTDNIGELAKDAIVKIFDGYVRENNGRKEVHLNDKARLILNPPGETIGEVKAFTSTRRKIKELREGDENVELLGTVVQIFDPRFYEVCEVCNKRARQREDAFVCEQHGSITPAYAYVMNLILDDGTETIRVVFFKNQVERLLQKTKEAMLAYREKPEDFESVKTDLLGTIIKLVGRVSKNTMFDRLEFVSQLVFPNPDPEEEVKRLSEDKKEPEIAPTP